VGVNVTSPDFHRGDLETRISEVFARHNVPLKHLVLEVNEEVFMGGGGDSTVAASVETLRENHMLVALDDFGTGYASLSHVNPKEIDRLKIDRRFVQKIDTNDDNRTIVKAITELARGLGISVIAEGAETEEELASLRAVGCDHVQGYSIAYPMPAERVREWLSQRAPRRPRLKVAASNVA
jgi:EAL domain-containing protein (putative c-di-GMP-specific phosphodiesterase class I)